jgi:hypothetical protein
MYWGTSACAVNGANSLKLMSIVPTVARNASFDQPVLAVYANIGNDICSERQNLDHVRDQSAVPVCM